jgi:hypothetical protein
VRGDEAMLYPHRMARSADTWQPVISQLGTRYQVIVRICSVTVTAPNPH